MTNAALSPPPARQIRVLANVAPAGAVVSGLLCLWLVVSTVRGVGQLLGPAVGPGQPVLAGVVLVVLSAAAAVVTGLIAYRLGVQVPRTLRGWDDALAERTQALRGD